MKKILFLFLLTCIFTVPLRSQDDLGALLQKAGQDYATKYLAPLTTGLGTNLNTGFLGGFSPSGYSKIPIIPHVWAGIKFSGVIMQDKDKYFNTSYTTTSTIQGQNVTVNWQVNNAPTVFGSTTPAVARGTFTLGGVQRDTSINIIGGLGDSKFVPLFIPQVGVGTILGTDLILRTIPSVSVGNYGKFNLYGGAIRHNIGSYAMLPIDIAFQIGYQHFSITDKNDNKYFSANSMFANVQVNKSFPFVDIYAGLQYENYSVDINYTYQNPFGAPITVAFNQKGENTFRTIVGATLTLGPVMFNADANIGTKFVVSVGLGVGL